MARLTSDPSQLGQSAAGGEGGDVSADTPAKGAVSATQKRRARDRWLGIALVVTVGAITLLPISFVVVNSFNVA